MAGVQDKSAEMMEEDEDEESGSDEGEGPEVEEGASDPRRAKRGPRGE